MPERWSMSVCPYCGVGCGLEVGVTDATGRTLFASGHLDADGWLDLYATTGFNSADRTKPDG